MFLTSRLLHNPFIFVQQVDIAQLSERSKGTKWAWGAVDAWIDQGISGSRVLCLLADAGTGKSTISVAIWEEVKPKPN